MTEHGPRGTPPGRDAAFVRHLCGLAGIERRAYRDDPDADNQPKQPDLAALATLRRGLGRDPAGVLHLYRVLGRFVPDGERDADRYLMVAALFGSHPLHWPGRWNRPRQTNLGASFARFWAQQRADNPDATGPERRFVALLDTDADDLADALRHAVSLLRADQVPVDWLRLLRDLRGWDRVDRRVQRDWARSFWSSEAATDAPDAAGNSASPEEVADSPEA